ncbi:MAG TPA: prenyltransferase/squalene oxidase repeat-containing protein [Pirellulales bacterium]|nr:prenyltransferase/squalene oxidase repeat-containing protein [Pirellulales bacterium]
MKRTLRLLRAVSLVLLTCAVAPAEDKGLGWNPAHAGGYLDERQKEWFVFDSRGEGATRSTCLSCHTVLPYMLSRPVLRKITASAAPSEAEGKLLAQTRMRVESWDRLDTPPFGLFYDDSDQKKAESWGTEAVFNALVLAFDDRDRGRSSPSDATRLAFSHLWATQVQTGELRGAWRWLDFSEPPWGSKDSTYFGAALAAIAVGTAPGYYTPGADADTDARVLLLRDYLRTGLDRENLHNQAWALWAGSTLDGLLTQEEREKVISRLVDKQHDDGGWSLSSLGPWARNDGTAQDTASDGYATGFVLHVLQIAGVPKTNAKVARGLDWLKTNQSPAGEWRGASVVKKRDPATHVGKFMSDAATAFAVLALSH